MAREQVPFNPKNITIYPAKGPTTAIFDIFRGHSDEDEGAESPTTALTEYDFYGPVGHNAALQLAELGVEVHLYERDKWGEFYDMTQYLNHVEATGKMRHLGGISLHLNAFNERANGTEALYWHTSEKGKLLAWHTSRPFVRLLGTKDRGIVPLKRGERAYNIVLWPHPPWAILEAAFIDCGADEEKLRRHWNLMDEALVTGVVGYSLARGLKSNRLLEWQWDYRTNLLQDPNFKNPD